MSEDGSEKKMMDNIRNIEIGEKVVEGLRKGLAEVPFCINDIIIASYTQGFQDGRKEWIPIAERKPEKHGRYLVSAYDHNRKCLEVGISYFYPQINDFCSPNAYEDYYWEVKAWMPQPEPYKEKGKRIRKRKKNDG